MTIKQDFTIIEMGSITSPKGFTAGGLHCGLKKSKRHDIGAIWCDVPAVAAGVYTLNVFQAAPLQVTKDSIAVDQKLQAMIVNSGNANACTGKQGEEDAREMRSTAAKALNIPDHLVGVTSTGVIGQPLPMNKIVDGINKLPAQLHAEGGEDFCQAILTTDLVQKMIAVSVMVDGQEVRIAGAAKGSGMIHPNMATMLGFMTTDAKIDHKDLQFLLNQATDSSFNMITVDGDTSTNDMVVAMASGMSYSERLHPGHPDWDDFAAAFLNVAQYLAKAIARDGEGATKLLEVVVTGAESDLSASRIVKTVIGSSLVKSAIFGADANWGRIIAAVGRSGEQVNPDTVDIRVGDISMMEQSRPIEFDEDRAAVYLRGENVQIGIALNMGEGTATGWGCDLTYEYVRINAAYRT
jgi:glutamate N-acetyltransferase/amino-acid N-acetyltransferase